MSESLEIDPSRMIGAAMDLLVALPETKAVYAVVATNRELASGVADWLFGGLARGPDGPTTPASG
jgi:hypothetical protein